MSQDQMSEAVASPPVAASDGMFRPGRTQRETLLMVLRLAGQYETWVTLAELAAMEVRTSQYNPGNEVPEKNWLYRIAKRYWFNDFGVYRGHDHSRTSAPGLLREEAATAGGVK